MMEKMISRRALIGGLAAVGISLAMPVWADDDLTADERRARWDSMSQEERQALMEQRRVEFEAMTPEEREAFRREHHAQREERRARFEAMSPEEREAIRQERRSRWESMTPEQRDQVRQRMQRRDGRHQGRGQRGGKHKPDSASSDDSNQ